ncbi:MAG: hypothetical protein R3C49_25505 [Planctomycetaceae bacterium]
MHGFRFISVLLLAAGLPCSAQEAERADDGGPRDRIGQFLTLTSPLGDAQLAQAGNLAIELQARAEREDREAVLILEIPPGTSRFGQVSDLARKLTSSEIPRVRTVAWLPKTVDGYHAIIALACHDIVMDPDASLGDIGRGSPVSAEEQQFILSIVDRRRNSRLSRGVVQAMLDPATELLRVRLEGAAGMQEQRFLTLQELKQLQAQKTVISETEPIKEVGAPGLFHASDAVRTGFLVAKTVKNRRDVATLYSLPTESLREHSGGDRRVNARLIGLQEMITPLTEEFILRQMRTAIAEGANLLVFDIESPGGYLDASVNIANAIADLDPAKVTTVAWIPERALSGAAVVSLGTDRIIMKPDAHLGDAGVIQETEEGGAFERVPEKLWSDFLVTLQDLAERKQRPPALLQAMVDRNLQVFRATHAETGRVTYMSEYEINDSADEWIKGEVVPESREEVLLTVNGRRAFELGLAEKPCSNFDELKLRLGIPEGANLAAARRTWVEHICIYPEHSGRRIRTDHSGDSLRVHGTASAVRVLRNSVCGAVLSVLLEPFTGGTSGSLELIMFLLGVGLLALEIFVIPGFGVFGVSGLLLMGGALVMASHTFSGMTAGERFNESMGSLGSLAGALLTVIVVAVSLNRFLPSIPFLNRLILTPPGYTGESGGVHLNPALLTEDQETGPVSVGAFGTTASTLRPTGKATFGDLFLDVVSDGGYVDHGVPVEVVRISGKRILVRPVEQTESEA